MCTLHCDRDANKSPLGVKFVQPSPDNRATNEIEI